ncbi:MAG: hypothetical protein D6741_04190 [Planctomycetota bacterium]|nr:MAG: hypothetical protein D6741_04190 [Planctomycetota bacterium]
MCILALQFQTARDAPVLIAHNREERFDRPSQGPKIQSGRPRVICGIDKKAGGTWLGVNQHGLVVAVANRPKRVVPPDPISRGVLCRQLLTFNNAKDAAETAYAELRSGKYAGANYLCVDRNYAAVVYGGDYVELERLTPGLYLMTNGRVNDPDDARQRFLLRLLTLQRLDSAVTFLAVASRAFARPADEQGRWGVVLKNGQYGTVSSTLLSLTERPQSSIMQYASGPPSENDYEDVSALLRQVLSSDR